MERTLEQLKRTANIGPELISSFSKLETMADQRGNSESRRRTPKGSSRTGSSGQLAQGAGSPLFLFLNDGDTSSKHWILAHSPTYPVTTTGLRLCTIHC